MGQDDPTRTAYEDYARNFAFTQDIGRAMRLASAIEVGLCWINSWFLRDLRTPFGGSKQSGIGREGGLHGLGAYVRLEA